MSKQTDPIPDKFSSYEEAGKFWDTRDTTDYPDVFSTIERGHRRSPSLKHWSDPSVLKLAGQRDPISVITEKAQEVVFKAMERGWQGPPFDPFQLAEILKIKVIPRNDIGDILDDALIRQDPGDRLVIEYNPNKPARRIRFSICHEIAHSFFSDCAAQIRHRQSPNYVHGMNRELETLCNLGAAELLMPIGSFSNMMEHEINIDRVLELRKQFEVSTEAVLLRAINLSKEPLAAFSATAKESPAGPRYRIEYCISSKPWIAEFRPGMILPEDTKLKDCIAIGYTTKGLETWKSEVGQIEIQAVGLPPYPVAEKAESSDYLLSANRANAQSLPRVVGFIRPQSSPHLQPGITYLQRDATVPIDSRFTLIAHIVNDRTPNWGAGFGRAVARTWPDVQAKFRSIWMSHGRLPLGTTSLTEVEVSPNVSVFHMVAQHGYGPSSTPRLRYEKLRVCLEELAKVALSRNARVQMPRIGAGEARGSWPVIEEMIEDKLSRRGIDVFVCDLPGTKIDLPNQLELAEQLKNTA